MTPFVEDRLASSATGQYPGWEIRDKRSTCSDSLLELNTTP